MKTTRSINPTTNKAGIKAISPLTKIMTCLGLLLAASLMANAGAVRTWTGAGADGLFSDPSNWGGTLPSAASADTMQWNGTAAGDLWLTNDVSFGPLDSGTVGVLINVASGQTGALTFVGAYDSVGGSYPYWRWCDTNMATLMVNSGAGAVTFGTEDYNPMTILLGSGGTAQYWTNNSASPVTFGSYLAWSADTNVARTVYLGGTGNWQFNGTPVPVAPVYMNFTCEGPGTVNILGNRYTSTTGTNNITVNSGGTLQLSGNYALSASTLTMNAGANLDSSVESLAIYDAAPQYWNGNFTFLGTQSLDTGPGPVTLSTNRVVTVLATNLTISGVISGAGCSLTKAGPGTLVLNNANEYTGGTVISNGVLSLNYNGATAGLNSNSVAAYGSGTLDLNSQTVTIDALNGNGVVDSIASYSYSSLTVGGKNGSGAFKGVIQNSGGGSLTLSKTGTGTQTLGGANSTYSGGTTIYQGALLVTNTTGSATGSGTVTVSGGTFGGPGIVSGPVTWNAGAAAEFFVTPAGGNNTTPLTINNTVSLSTNPVIVYVPGTVPLGVGVYTLVTYQNSGSSGIFSASKPTFTGAGLVFGATATVIPAFGQAVLQVTSTITGLSSTWTNNGNGSWSGAANWSSNPTIPHNPGDFVTLGVGSAFTTVGLGASETIGGLLFNNPNCFAVTNAANTLTFDNSGHGAVLSATAGASNSISASVSLNDDTGISMGNGAALAISGPISGARQLTLNGNGALTLSGSNSCSGGITLGGAQLNLNSPYALGTGPLTNSGSATIDNTSGSVITLGFTNRQYWNGDLTFLGTSDLNLGASPVTLSAGHGQVSVNKGTLTVGGVISGAGILTNAGPGTLLLPIANTYSNGTYLLNGTLSLGNDSAMGTGALYLTPTTPNGVGIKSSSATARVIANAVNVNSGGGVFVFGSTGAGQLTFNGTIASGNLQKTFVISNLTYFSGVLTDNGAPTGYDIKDGPSTLVLKGNNNALKKVIQVNAGTLQLGHANAIGTNALIMNGGKLDVTGALANAGNNPQVWNADFSFVGTASLDMGTGGITLNNNVTITVSTAALTNRGAISGAGYSLTKAGGGTLVFYGSGANNYNNTTVSAGTLEFVQPTLPNNGIVSVANGTALKLDFNATNDVAGLILAGVGKPDGVYKNGAPGVNGLITGLGALHVVNPTLTAGFTMGPVLTGAGSLPVSLTNTSTYYESATWYFGDGAKASSLANVLQHTYAVSCSGLVTNYTASLAVTNGNGVGQVVVASAPVTVYPQPTVAWAANTTLVATNVTVYFTNSSCYTPGSAVVWNFGDGSGLVTSSATYVTHSYAVSNLYPVTLTVTNQYGYGAMFVANLTVLNKIVPAASFTMGPVLSGVGPLTVNLTNTTTSGTYTSALWRFGNGSTSNTMSSPIQFTYSSVACSALAQTNLVSLAATNNGDGTVFTNPTPVVVYPQPTAALAANYSSVATNVTVSFTNSSCYTPGTTNVVWNFGDGSGLLASSAAYVTHSYAASNTYPVTLTVTNQYGYGAVALGSVTVTNLPASSVIYPTSVVIWKVQVQTNDLKIFGSNLPVTANAQFYVRSTNNVALARSTWVTNINVVGDTQFNGLDGRFTNVIKGGATNGAKGFFWIYAP